MTEERLPPRARERRVMAIGALTIVLIFTAKATPVVLEQLRALSASDRLVVASAARVEADLLSLPAVRDSLVARRVRLAALDSAVLDSDSQAAGSASLAEMLSDASQIAKTELGPVQLMPEQRDS